MLYLSRVKFFLAVSSIWNSRVLRILREGQISDTPWKGRILFSAPSIDLPVQSSFSGPWSQRNNLPDDKRNQHAF